MTIENEAQLYDLLQTRHGIGDDPEGLPYWKFRANEAAKIKSMLRRRKVTLDEMVLASDYAIRHNKTVTSAFALLGLITLAKRENRVPKRRATRQQLIDAAGEAAAAGHADLAMRLYNTDPSEAEAVLAEWEALR